MAQLTQRQREFAREAYQAAHEAGLRGVAADLAVSQAVHETGWGRSPSGLNNYHGIKGKGTARKTWEVVGGVRKNITAKFADFGSMKESFRAWKDLVGRKWPDALRAPSLPEAVQGLRAGFQGGYATDPRYNAKIENIGNTLEMAGKVSSAPLPTPAPRSIGAGIPGEYQYAGLTRSAGPVSPATPAETYGQFGRTMQGTGLQNLAGKQTYSAPLGPVERGPSLAPAQSAPSQTFGNMLSGMDSPVYGPGQIAPSSPPQKAAPSAAELASAYGQMGSGLKAAGVNLAGTPTVDPNMAKMANEYGYYGLTRSLAPAAPAQPYNPAPPEVQAPTIAAPQEQTVATPAQTVQAPQQTIGAFPAAPEPYSAPKSKVGQRVAGALLGGLLGGLPGAAMGGLLGPSAMNSMKGNPLGGIGNAFGGLFGGTPNPGRFDYGSGVNAISDILGGGGTAGATAYSRSTPGYSVTNLGNGMVAKTNQYGVTSYDYTGPTTSLFGGKGGGNFGSGRDASKSEADRGGRGVSAGGKGLW